MPREMIHNSDSGPWFPKVGWSADGGVQIGVENDEERSMFWLLLGDTPEALTALGDIVRTIADTPDRSDEDRGRLLLDSLDVRTGYYRGVWASLDRGGLNRLVRILRKARDAAWGADA